MKASSVRIGNLVYDGQKREFKITAQDIVGMLQMEAAGKLPIETGIRITDEKLIDLKFGKIISYFIETSKDKFLELGWNDVNKWYAFFRNKNHGSPLKNPDDYVILKDNLQYIHEIQNLYFDLSGKELI